jgi:Trk K+ transport system NAD-binding subunit
VVGKTIEEIGLPDSVVVASIVRGDEAIMASRTLMIEENK